MPSLSWDHSFSNSDWSSSNDHEKMLFDEMEQKVVMFFQCAFNNLNYEDNNDNENEGTRKFVDLVVGVLDVFTVM
jgi:hypothetical protein